MNTRTLISQICRAITFSSKRGWHHGFFGLVAPNDELRHLTRFLYEYYYLGLPKNRVKLHTNVGQFRSLASYEAQKFTDKLRSAVPHAYFDSHDWKQLDICAGKMIVEQNGVQLSLEEGQWKVGSRKGTVTVHMPTERRYASPGFFTAFSSSGPPCSDVKIDRLYVNVAACDADRVMGRVLLWASKNGLNAIAKVANNRSSYDRSDPFVAYFPRAQFRPQRAALIAELMSRHYRLRPVVPAFTCCLGEGLSWAEDPASDGLGHVGFGMHRCSFIARALDFTRKNQCSNPGDIEKEVLLFLQNAGLDVDCPHRSPSR